MWEEQASLWRAKADPEGVQIENERDLRPLDGLKAIVISEARQ